MRRRDLLLAAAAAAMTGCAGAPTAGPGRTFLVAHGAWSAGWSWRRMHPLMSAAGHRLFVPSYTGLGERAHLATPETDLETHIQDVLGVLRSEELRDVVLVGHSYGGMVATGVADRAPELLRQIIYVDAFVPRDGQSLLDIVPADTRERFHAGMAAGDGWRVPPMPIPEDTSPEDVRWIETHRIAQPLHCFDRPLRLARGDTKVPRAYVYALRRPPVDTFGPFAARAKAEGWVYREIDASHSPQITAPQALADLLSEIASAEPAAA